VFVNREMRFVGTIEGGTDPLSQVGADDNAGCDSFR
jgi:hypothetical protein